MLTKLYSNLLALILMIIAGAVLGRAGYFSDQLRRGLNRLIFDFTLPLYVFSSMQSSISNELLANSLYPLVFGAGLSALNWVSASLLGRLWGTERSERPLLQFMTMFGNNLYLALPMVTALFGVGTAPVVLLYSTGSDLVFWTAGVAMLSRQSSGAKGNLRQVFNPTLLGLVLGSAVGLLGLQLPFALSEAASKMGSLTTPLSLMLTGAALSGIKLKEATGLRETTALLVGKLLVSPLIAAIAVRLLGLQGTLAQVLIIMASMPTIVRSIVLTEQYGWDSRKTALGVLVTTVASFLTIPLVLNLIMR